MVKVKSLEEVKSRYKGAISEAARRYAEAAPKIVWKEQALAGQKLYEDRMRDEAVLKRRAKAIEKVSDEEFRRAVIQKGVGRIRSGMEAAVDKQAANWAPYRAALEAVTLPEKTTDPIANIDNRVKPIVEALVKKKKELLGE